MFKKIVAIIVMISIVGCSTTPRQVSESGMSMPEIMRALKNSENDISFGTFDPRGYPYTITNTYSSVGALATSKTKSMLMFHIDERGFVTLDKNGDPLVKEIRTYEYEGGGWVQVAVMIVGAAASAAMVGVFAGVGRPCRGCGGGGTTVYNHNESESFSGAELNNVNDFTVGCSTGKC